MKNIIRNISIFTSLLVLASCSDLNNIEDRLDSLENRIEVLENVLPRLNANIEALQALSNAGTINSVSEKDGVYTLKLSNGETITLTQGTVGVGNPPIMSIDKDGYWMVDYQDGKGAGYLLLNGEKVMAKGINGKTPKFGVDANGYWTVDYGSGAEIVKGADGQSVSAISTEGQNNDAFFNSVSYTDGVFVLELKNGETIQLPVLNDFLCEIENSDTEQVFSDGETKEFSVTMKGVVSSSLTLPEGWSGKLEENKLTITAPSFFNTGTESTSVTSFTPIITNATKAVLADSKADVCILAISKHGYATIAKLKVRYDNSSSPNTPITPPTYSSLYEAYNDNQDVTIAGKTYNKASNGEAILLTASSVDDLELRNRIVNGASIIFLEAEGENCFAFTAITEIKNNVVIASNNPTKKVKIHQKSNFKLMSGSFVAQNIIWDSSSISTYFYNNANATANLDTYRLESCEFPNLATSLFYLSTPGFGIVDFYVNDCIFEISSTANAKYQLFNLYKSTVLHVYKSIVFTNNIVFSGNSAHETQIINYDQNIAQSTTNEWTCNFVVENNLFYNVPSSNGMFKFYQLGSMSIAKNILFCDDSAYTGAHYTLISYSSNQTANGIDVQDNIAFGLSKDWTITHSNSTFKANPNKYTKLAASPLSSVDLDGKKFVVKDELKEYGPQN